ncbi:hypothetical protein EAL2_808p06410 (plasmid) [Peptoclostridium acidaminophilum DSM 3953]|uniref:Copper amine oxidase-like N-terminal domain-containing protein n=1 Tax=Peptoclostridium acidaminophilum DSM 3953 TaxID=1286171 RepID=W8T907_PEPAC|nr:copper amine oxidase N-terminal domain-containing protein [Peptoclostridium acidaminophilum]AHM58144.1 hypothetical protein EAL2_808p06410 [Peptoclostridium acidaminophilum DSM 3953]
MNFKKSITTGLAACMILGSLTASHAMYDPNMDYSKLDPNKPMILKADTPMLISEQGGEASHASEAYTVAGAISVGGDELSAKAIKKEDGTIMIPLRAVAEKLGYELKWSGNDKPIEIVRGPQWTTVTIGKNSYFFAKMAPMQLKSAPVLYDSATYVPVEFIGEIFRTEYKIGDNGAISVELPDGQK